MRGHANNFDGLRLIGALLVLFSHMFALSGRWEPTPLPENTFGTIGVLIFFSISGYLISASWQSDPDLGRFLAKRFLRMAPGVAVALPLAFVVVWALGMKGFPGHSQHHLNGSLWTIPYEVYCYLLLAGASMLAPNVATPVLALAAIWAYKFLPESPFLPYFGMYFAAGALLHAYPKLRTGKALIGWVLAAAVAHHEIKLSLALIVPPLTIYIGTRSWPLLRDAGRFGDLSYGVYIYAWPVQQIIVELMGKESSYPALLLPSLVITTALAWLSWRYVEAPALGRKPKREQANESPVTVAS